MTTRIGIIEMVASQYQKEVTFNELCWLIDLFVGGVASATRSSPPSTPANGESYIIPSGASGAWSSHVGAIAQWLNGAWKYYTPVEGASLVAADNNKTYKFQDSAWRTDVVCGNVIIDTAGKGFKIKEGSNARMGIVTLSSGAATVNNATVTANTRIFLSVNGVTAFANLGILYEDSASRVPGTSFTIKSTNGADTASIAWVLIEPAA